jgi:hypothetical protein
MLTSIRLKKDTAKHYTCSPLCESHIHIAGSVSRIVDTDALPSRHDTGLCQVRDAMRTCVQK